MLYTILYYSVSYDYGLVNLVEFVSFQEFIKFFEIYYFEYTFYDTISIINQQLLIVKIIRNDT